MIENANDAEWADKQMHSMLNYAEQKVDIFVWLTELLDSDRTLRNDMWEISVIDDIFNKQSQLHVMWNQSKVLHDRKIDWSVMSVIKCDCVNSADNNEQWKEAVNFSAD